MRKANGFSLAVGLEDNELFDEGMIFKLLLAGGDIQFLSTG